MVSSVSSDAPCTVLSVKLSPSEPQGPLPLTCVRSHRYFPSGYLAHLQDVGLLFCMLFSSLAFPEIFQGLA